VHIIACAKPGCPSSLVSTAFAPSLLLCCCQLLGDFLAEINHHRGLYDKLRQTQAAYSATAAAAASSSRADAQLSSGEQVRCNDCNQAVTSCSNDCPFMLFMVLLPWVLMSM
jgi:hypothetical protein